MTLQERFEYAFRELNRRGLQAEIARVCGVSAPTVSAWFKNPEKVSTVERAHAEKLCAYFSLTVEPMWLAEGVGPMEFQGRRSQPVDIENNPDYPAIKFYPDWRISAGASGFALEYDDGGGSPIVFQKQWFERHGFRPEKLFAVRVGNSSMEPGLFHDDVVVVNTDQKTPKDGVVFAVDYEGEMVIKRLVRDSGQWWLTSDNADQKRYPRKLCDDHCKLLGEVVHKQSQRI